MAAKLGLGGAKRILPDAMVWEIMTWLPTKSLMRFKTVSKSWLSTILDPKFARAHRSPFRGLLVMNYDPSPAIGWSQPTRDFYIANLDDANGDNNNEVNVSFQFSIPEDIRHLFATNMVNGLICFYDRSIVKLCNIATREIINLPQSRCAYTYCTYHLGFDPIQSVYKLLKICPIYEFYDEQEDADYWEYCNDFMEGDFSIRSIECEILTLGVDSSWRSINPPPNSIIPHGLCVDGVLYWMTVVPGLQTADYPLFSFNLTREKFQSICKPRDRVGYNQRLLDFGSPALVQSYSYNTPNIITVTHFVEGCWTGMNKYNMDLCRGWSMSFQDVRGMLPNGDLMIYSHEGVRDGSSIFLFDENKNGLQNFILRFPPSDILLFGRILWYEENIISLKSLTDICEQRRMIESSIDSNVNFNLLVIS